MMRMQTIIVLLVLLSCETFAQEWADEDQHPVNVNLSEVALINIQPNNSEIAFEIVPPTSAGNPPEVIINSKSGNVKWLNYTSALENFQKGRSIFVEISEGTMPSGLQLVIAAEEFAGKGEGQHGKTVGKVTVSKNPVLLISDIKGCYTGVGVSNGHKLTYYAIISDLALLNPKDEDTIEITFTITDN